MTLLLLLIVPIIVNAQQQKTVNLMPVPKSINLPGGDFKVSPGFIIGIFTKKITAKSKNRQNGEVRSNTVVYDTWV